MKMRIGNACWHAGPVTAAFAGDPNVQSTMTDDPRHGHDGAPLKIGTRQ